jgi:hypothetical protein
MSSDRIYDYRTIGFIAHTSTVTVTSTVPEVMVGHIPYARYSIGGQTATITVKLMQERLGTVTGTLDVVTLTPAKPTIPETAGKIDDVVAIVDPGHKVVAVTTTGSVEGKIIFGYMYGRTRRA